MIVGRCFSLLPHQAGMKPIHGIALTPLNAVAVLSVGHYFPSPASALGIYLWVNNLSLAGAAKVVHLRDHLQSRLRKGLGKVAHKAVAGTLASMYQRKRYEIYLLRLLLCRCGNSRFGRIWLALFVGVVCKVLRRGLVLAGNIPGKTGTISQKIAMVIQDGDYLTAGIWVAIVMIIAFLVIFLMNIISGSKMKHIGRW